VQNQVDRGGDGAGRKHQFCTQGASRRKLHRDESAQRGAASEPYDVLMRSAALLATSERRRETVQRGKTHCLLSLRDVMLLAYVMSTRAKSPLEGVTVHEVRDALKFKAWTSLPASGPSSGRLHHHWSLVVDNGVVQPSRRSNATWSVICAVDTVIECFGRRRSNVTGSWISGARDKNK
jgi:hypothetical protein